MSVGRDPDAMLRALWHLVWTGEVRNDDFRPLRNAHLTSGLSLGYLESGPRIGRWHATECLDPSRREAPEAEVRALRWAEALLGRWGIVSRDVLKREIGAPPWRDLRRALTRLDAGGVVHSGPFVRGLNEPQYASGEALDLIAATPRPDADGPMILLSLYDPANLFAFQSLFRLTDESGTKPKLVQSYYNCMVFHAGQLMSSVIC